MPRSPTSSSQRRAELAATALLLLACLAGCVTRGTHREVVIERDRLADEARRLADRVTLLEASNESLSQERIALLEEVEDLREERNSLANSIETLERARGELEQSVRSHEAELARRGEEIGRLRDTYDGLVEDLQSEVAAGRIQVEQLREGLRVNLAQEILFPLGSAELNGQGRDLLAKVADRLRGLPHAIEVQGHTDALPIHGTLARRYPTNWELAAARASQVVRLFEHSGIDARRLKAVSYADTRPVASNETAEGRARNRRIEVRLAPVEAEAGAAAPAVEAPSRTVAPSASEASPVP